MSNLTPAPKKKIFYGWWITLLAGLTYFGSNGLLNSSSGTITSQMLLVRGWDPAQVTLSNTVRSLMMFALPLVGLAVRRFGPRKCICITTLVTALFMALTGWAATPLAFIVLYGLAVGFSMMFNDQLACFTAVNNWWDRRRGEQAGYLNALGALGGVVFPPIVAFLFVEFSWNVAMVVMAVALVVITALPQWFFMKDHPSELGLEVDGGKEIVVKEKKKTVISKPLYRSKYDWDVRDVLRTPQLWLVALGWAGVACGTAPITFYGISHCVMNGWGEITAAGFISAFNLFILVSSIIFGRFADRIPPRIMLCILCLGQALFVLLWDAGGKLGSWPLMILSVVVGGLSNGPCIPTVMSALCQFYGPKNYPAIQPYTNIVVTISATVIATVGGFIFAQVGSFTPTFFVNAGICTAIAILLLVTLRPPKMSAKLEAKYEARAKAEAEASAQQA